MASNKVKYQVYITDQAKQEIYSVMDVLYFEEKEKAKLFIKELNVYLKILELEPETFKMVFFANRLIKIAQFSVHLVYLVENLKKRIIIHSCIPYS